MDLAELPPYKDFLLPVLRAVEALGGTAHAKEITAWMVENLGFDDDAVAVEYPNRPGESVMLDRMAWARSYDKLGGLVETPQRGLYVLTTEGKRVLSLPETEARQLVDEMDRQVRKARTRQKVRSTVVHAGWSLDLLDELGPTGVIHGLENRFLGDSASRVPAVT